MSQNIYYIMERMGTEATKDDAVAMLEILNANGLKVADISNMSEDCWLTLCNLVLAHNT